MNAPNPLSPEKRGADRKAYEPSMEEILASIRRIIADDQAFAMRPPAPPPAGEEPVSEAASIAEPEAENPPPQPRFPKPDFLKRDVLRPESLKVEVPEPEPAQETAPPAAEIQPEVAPAAPPTAPAFPVEAKFQFFKSAAISRRVEPTPPPIEPAVPEPEPAVVTIEPAPTLQQSAPEPPQMVVSPPAEAEAEPDLPLISPETGAAVSSAFHALAASQLMPSPESLTEMAREMMRPMLKAWLDDNLPILVERLVRAEIERVARGGR